MFEVDESDLIGFFGVVPEDQSQDEREFFDAPLFVKSVGAVRLTYSLSFHFKDLELRLGVVGEQPDVLDCHVGQIETVRIEPDSTGRSWLRARSTRGDEVAVAVAPTIAVSVSK